MWIDKELTAGGFSGGRYVYTYSDVLRLRKEIRKHNKHYTLCE